MNGLEEKLFESQNRALRNPAEIFGSSFEIAGITPQTLQYEADVGFKRLIHDLDITLVIGREYENLVIALSPESKDEIRQTFFHLPHPSGIVFDSLQQSLFIAATRNPNQIIEFKAQTQNVLIPVRAKFYPGRYYFHDLALINNKLYANSVGQNGIIQVEMEN